MRFEMFSALCRVSLSKWPPWTLMATKHWPMPVRHDQLEAKGQATKAAILTAARAVFVGKGFSQATVDDITKTHDGHLDTGVLGSRVLLQAALRADHLVDVLD